MIQHLMVRKQRLRKATNKATGLTGFLLVLENDVEESSKKSLRKDKLKSCCFVNQTAEHNSLP